MEAFGVLVVLTVLGAVIGVVVGAIQGMMALAQTRRLERQIEDLKREVQRLRRQAPSPEAIASPSGPAPDPNATVARRRKRWQPPR